MMDDKKLYIDFFSKHGEICIFSSPWWLDVVAGPDNWDVILIKNKNSEIIASFPYVYRKGRVITSISSAMLTQKLGPYIVYPSNMVSEQKRISYEHEIYEQIIEALPKFSTFDICFDQKYKNWLPFYWNHFTQTTNYSYRVYSIKEHERVFNEFIGSKRTLIRKAEDCKVKMDLDFDLFYDYFTEAVKERGEDVLYSREFFLSLCNAVYEHNQGRIFYCEDKAGNINAISLVVWDNECAYYLIAMRKNEYKNTGASELLVFEMMKYVSKFVDIFDFEGSMMKGVEESYRKYGAHQTEYYNISKDNRKFPEKCFLYVVSKINTLFRG